MCKWIEQKTGLTRDQIWDTSRPHIPSMNATVVFNLMTEEVAVQDLAPPPGDNKDISNTAHNRLAAKCGWPTSASYREAPNYMVGAAFSKGKLQLKSGALQGMRMASHRVEMNREAQQAMKESGMHETAAFLKADIQMESNRKATFNYKLADGGVPGQAADLALQLLEEGQGAFRRARYGQGVAPPARNVKGPDNRCCPQGHVLQLVEAWCDAPCDECNASLSKGMVVGECTQCRSNTGHSGYGPDFMGSYFKDDVYWMCTARCREGR